LQMCEVDGWMKSIRDVTMDDHAQEPASYADVIVDRLSRAS
jgi:hypothetical protein